MSANDPLILVRLAAEVTIKSRRTRSSFLRQLRTNVRDALTSAGIQGELDSKWGRLFVRAPAGLAVPTIARVFGISSVSEVGATVPAELETIVRTGAELFEDRVRGRLFAVRARRVGKHSFSSKDIEIQLGSALLPHAAGVRLDKPEVTVQVEVRDESAYLFSDRVAGVGGLPVAVEGRAVALLSGGYDSAVAAWLMLKRGLALDYVFCNLGGDAYERAVVQVAKLLADAWSYGTSPRLHIVDFDAPVRTMKEHVRESYWQVVLKRLMVRTASRVGAQLGALAIVTGEAIGQVSSQTAANLRAIEPAASLPLFRPLLGFDKEEIIARARDIGTGALSEQVKEYCAMTPGHPVTAATVERVDTEEARMDLAVLDDAIASRKILDLRSLAPTDLVGPYLFIDEIPEGAVVLDCRTPDQFRAWHLRGAARADEWQVLRDLRSLDKDRTYVLYCAYGVQTAYLAERMQRAGFEAYSFRGGVRGLMEYARMRGQMVTG
jgi:thiamine biosynthesis protein ThiI